MTIPIYKPYLPKDSLKYAHEALDSTWISYQGKYIQMVQEKLQELLNVKYVLPVNNGTSACHLVAKSVSKKQIFDIIIPDNVYVAAWNAFLFDCCFNLYAVPCDIGTWNYDFDALDKAITLYPHAAVLIVHNIGNVMNVPELKRKYPKTLFVEDNCEGFLGKYEGVFSGTKSHTSAISFFGNKNITSGEGGAFITNDEDAYLHAKCVQAQGQSSHRFIHNELGYNYRMSNVQAAILYGQLEILPDILSMKLFLFNEYRNAFKDREDILMQSIDPKTEPSNWMFGVRVPGSTYKEAELYFKSNGIEIRQMFFPISSHQYMAELNDYVVNYGDCSKAEQLNKECFILPSFPELTGEEVSHIIQVTNNYTKENK